MGPGRAGAVSQILALSQNKMTGESPPAQRRNQFCESIVKSDELSSLWYHVRVSSSISRASERGVLSLKRLVIVVVVLVLALVGIGIMMDRSSDEGNPPAGNPQAQKAPPQAMKGAPKGMKGMPREMKGMPPEMKGEPSMPTQAVTPDPKTVALPGKVIKTKDGIQYADIKIGSGAIPTQDSKVTVNYTGWLLDGTKFDSSYDHGRPAEFVASQVIPGWTETLLKMKVGGKRKVIIPWQLAYGVEGHPPTIPAKADLVFVIELLDVK